jgi:hypothetical protein
MLTKWRIDDMAGEKLRASRKKAKFRRVDVKPFATNLCPFCEGELEHPLGLGYTTDQLVKYIKKETEGTFGSEALVKRWVMLGLLPRSVRMRTEAKGSVKPSSVGVFPKSSLRRVKLILLLRDKGIKEKDTIKYFEKKSLRFV